MSTTNIERLHEQMRGLDDWYLRFDRVAAELPVGKACAHTNLARDLMAKSARTVGHAITTLQAETLVDAGRQAAIGLELCDLLDHGDMDEEDSRRIEALHRILCSVLTMICQDEGIDLEMLVDPDTASICRHRGPKAVPKVETCP
jgi:hypothetical protein